MSFRDCVRIIGLIALLAAVPIAVYSFVELRDPFAFAAAESVHDLSSPEAFTTTEVYRRLGDKALYSEQAGDMISEAGSGLRELYKMERAKATFKVEQRARRRLFAFGALAIVSVLLIVVPLPRQR
jgi:hypothetical protein